MRSNAQTRPQVTPHDFSVQDLEYKFENTVEPGYNGIGLCDSSVNIWRISEKSLSKGHSVYHKSDNDLSKSPESTALRRDK